MTDDIVTRLRNAVPVLMRVDYPLTAEAFQMCADEIERLRAELAHAQTEIARLERLATNG